MTGILTDLRFGARMLWKRRGTSALAVVALSLGIGLTTIMFSIVQGVILRGLPFEDADAIVALDRVYTNSTGRAPVRVADFLDYRASQQSFEQLAAYREADITVSAEGLAERVDAARITANTLALLRVAPVRGRPFDERDAAPGAPPAALVSHRFWMTHLGGTDDVIGRVVRVDGVPTPIVGIMPERFAFPNTPAVWLPLSLDPASPRDDFQVVNAFGRLAETATLASATTELAVISRRLEAAYPENANVGVAVLPYIERALGGDVRSTLLAMLGAVCGVMLIACANVASLQIARSLERSREIAVRTALGAARSRVVRQLLTEGLALSAAGAAAGLVIAAIGVRVFRDAIVDTSPPFWIDIRIDTTVLAFVSALVVLATLAASLLPALRATRLDLNEVLKDEGRANTGVHMGRLGRGLVIVEVLVSCCLLVVSGLMIKSIVTIGRTSYPYETERVLMTGISAESTRYGADAERARLAETLIEALAAVPALRSVALTTGTPQGSGTRRIALEGETYAREDDQPEARRLAATPAIFDTLGIPVIRGRGLTSADTLASVPVAVVTQDFAERFFPSADPIGRRFRFGSDTEAPWITIVGLVPPVVVPGRDNGQVTALAFVPLAQAPVDSFTLLAATTGDSLAAVPAVRDVLRRIDPDLPLSTPRTLAQAYWLNTWAFRTFGGLFLCFGLAALVLASAGLYGVMAFTVARRTSEIGVRMALGASPGGVLGLFLRQGMTRVGLGIVLGLVPAWFLGHQMTELLYRTSAFDPVVVTTAVGVLLFAGLAASIVPARRAAAIDPAVALREQ